MGKNFKLFKINIYNSVLVFGMCLSTGIAIYNNFLLSEIIDILSKGKETFQTILTKGIFLLIVTICSIMCSAILSHYLPLKLQLTKSIETGIVCMKKLMKMSIKDYKENDNGYFMNILTSNSSTYGDLYSQISVQLVANILCTAIILIVSAFISPIFLIVYLCYIPLFYLTVKSPSRILSSMQKVGLKTQDAWVSANKKVVDCKREININRAEEYFEDYYKEKEYGFLSFITKFRFFQTITDRLPTLLSGIVQVIILIISSYLFYEGKILIGTIVFMFQLSSILQGPLSRCFEIIIYKKVNESQIERLEEFCEVANKDSEFRDLYVNDNNLLDIKFGKFYTDKNKTRLLFEGRNIKIEPKSFTLVKGENGSGKSIFLNYIQGLLDKNLFEGEISLNKELEKASYLTYPLLLVKGDLDENMFRENYNKELFDLLNFEIKNKEIDDTNINLSFGEQQKINLLRVLSKDNEVVILDEPFTNLDKETIAKLVELLLSKKGKISIIAIVHSNELDDIADNIFEIKNQQIKKIK